MLAGALILAFLITWGAIAWLTLRSGRSKLIAWGGGFLGACAAVVAVATVATRLVPDKTSDTASTPPASDVAQVPRSSTQNSGLTPEQETLRSRVIELSELNATKLGCDVIKNSRIIEIQYGTVAFDHEFHRRTAALSPPVPAVHAVTELTCLNQAQARKNQMFHQVILGIDTEFEVWRCPGIEQITVYDSTGNTSTGYKIDYDPYGYGNNIAKLRRECAFKTAGAAPSASTEIAVPSQQYAHPVQAAPEAPPPQPALAAAAADAMAEADIPVVPDQEETKLEPKPDANHIPVVVAPSTTGPGVRITQPEYPPSSRRNGEQGSVVLELQVTETGRISAADVLKSSGYPTLDQAAVKEVTRTWRLIPGTRDGVPTAMSHTVSIGFGLN